MERYERHRYVLWMILFLAVLLTACGSKERTLGIDGYVYVAEEIAMSEDSSYARDFRAEDGYFYYRQGNLVYHFPVEELVEGKGISSVQKAVFDAGKTGSLRGYTLDRQGRGYYILAESSWGEENPQTVLLCQEADGTESYQLDLEGVDAIHMISLAADDRGRVFLLEWDSLCVVDGAGKLIAEIPGSKLGVEFQAGNGRLLEGEDGSVYYSPAEYYTVVYEILGDDTAFREGTFQMKRVDVPGITGKCYSAREGLMCSASDGLLYQYQKESSEWKALLRYGDSNLWKQPYQMLQFSEEWMAACYNDYNGSADVELYFLTKTDASKLPEMEILVLAALSLSDEMEEYIANFNRTSGCHVIVDYYQGEGWGARLDARMVSSSPPDMVVLDDETVLKFAGKEALEDLNPYLESSAALGREDFLENLLEGYTIGDRLVCIPDSFYIYIPFGRASQLGKSAGWTANEVMAFVDAYPDARLFRTPTFTSMTAFFQEYILESYIDWKSGECCFDGEGFCQLVRWMEEHSDGFGSGYVGSFLDSWDSDGNKVPESQLLRPECWLGSFQNLPYEELRFGEDITAVGYPTLDGRVCYTAHANNAVGITAVSQNKESAWLFLEGFLLQDDKTFFNNFSSRKDLLISAAEEEMELDFRRDADGEIILSSTGEPSIERKGTFFIEGEEIAYYAMTQEQADKIMDIIESIDFTPRIGGLRYDIMGILLEELGPYIEGKRTLEESTRILQNRVQNLVQENL